jgi:glutamate synthase (NADPH/NADH) large chain
MTGGTVAILGPVGDNFGAGMTGGMAFIYDTDASLVNNINPDNVVYHRMQSPYWSQVLRDLVTEHWRETQSRFAERLLVDWDRELRRFWQVVPKEMLDKLENSVLVKADDEEKSA